MKPIFYMTVGLPGSGKSTWANEQKKENPDIIICSSDAIREELFGSAGDDVNTKENNTIVFETLHKRIKKGLSDGHDAIYDATNINSKKRMQFLQELELNKIQCHKKCLIFATEYEDCISYNYGRERVVPKEVIQNMYMHWETPYFFEGWDEIDIVYNFKNPEKDILKTLSDLYSYDQHNSHHSMTLGLHCFNVGCSIKHNLTKDILRQAGWLHDIGKVFTRTSGHKCNDPDEAQYWHYHAEAHYYNHENVGAYNAMFYKLNDTLLTSVLINLHMKPYSWIEEKTKEKYKKLWGDELFDMVIKLHEADKNNH